MSAPVTAVTAWSRSGARGSSNSAAPTAAMAGRGGHVIFEAVPNLNTLIDFRYTQHFRAPKGGNGAGSDRTGAGAKDVLIRVPIGTQIFDDDQETLLADLDAPEKRIVLCRGGDGGHGNAHFKSSTNRAPPPRRQGLARRGTLDLAAAEADRRCRPGRPAQCRQKAPSCPSSPPPGRRSPTTLHHAPPPSSASSACRIPRNSSSPTSPA